MSCRAGGGVRSGGSRLLGSGADLGGVRFCRGGRGVVRVRVF